MLVIMSVSDYINRESSEQIKLFPENWQYKVLF